MKKACYKIPEGSLVTVQQFHERATSEYKRLGIFPYCPECNEILEIYGINNFSISRFDHKNRLETADPLDDCSLADRGCQRFKFLTPIAWDYDRGKQLRIAFFDKNNLKIAYCFCLDLTRKGNLPLQKFNQMIQRADKKKIWSYTDIPLWSIPYILLTLENFTQPSTETKKGYDFHFVLEKPQNMENSSIWARLGETCLKKVFSSDGRNISTSDNPFPFSEGGMIEKAGNTDWIKDNFLKQLLACGQRE